MTKPSTRRSGRAARAPTSNAAASPAPESDCVAAALARLLAYTSPAQEPVGERESDRAFTQTAPGDAPERGA